ncbi:uncharacterized protein LOC135032966 [Pseudophryne corroboree]|uniref:uncharacterized protein LOC135032966 n=1 Tax=Pseudophryne corroboree TaxID=495146 RepID=UPI003081D4BA
MEEEQRIHCSLSLTEEQENTNQPRRQSEDDLEKRTQHHVNRDSQEEEESAEEGTSTRAPKFTDDETETLIDDVIKFNMQLFGSKYRDEHNRFNITTWEKISRNVSCAGNAERTVSSIKKRLRDCRRVTNNKIQAGHKLQKTWEKKCKDYFRLVHHEESAAPSSTAKQQKSIKTVSKNKKGTPTKSDSSKKKHSPALSDPEDTMSKRRRRVSFRQQDTLEENIEKEARTTTQETTVQVTGTTAPEENVHEHGTTMQEAIENEPIPNLVEATLPKRKAIYHHETLQENVIRLNQDTVHETMQTTEEESQHLKGTTQHEDTVHDTRQNVQEDSRHVTVITEQDNIAQDISPTVQQGIMHETLPTLQATATIEQENTETLHGTDGNHDTISERMGCMEQQMKEDIQRIENKLDNMQQTLTKMQQRLDEITTTQQSQGNALSSITSLLSHMNENQQIFNCQSQQIQQSIQHMVVWQYDSVTNSRMIANLLQLMINQGREIYTSIPQTSGTSTQTRGETNIETPHQQRRQNTEPQTTNTTDDNMARQYHLQSTDLAFGTYALPNQGITTEEHQLNQGTSGSLNR